MQTATTIAEAYAQLLTLPNKFGDQEWRRFARLMDGYSIAQALGFDLRECLSAERLLEPQLARTSLDAVLSIPGRLHERLYVSRKRSSGG